MLSLGCRLGELRALTFNDIDFNKKIITIRNSIEYDTSLNRLKGNSKNTIAQRDIFVTDKYLNEIFEYIHILSGEGYPFHNCLSSFQKDPWDPGTQITGEFIIKSAA